MQSCADDILFRTRGSHQEFWNRARLPGMPGDPRARGFVMKSKECVSERRPQPAHTRDHKQTRRCRHSSRQRSPLSERGPPPLACSLSRLPCAEGAIYLKSVLTKLTKRFIFNGLLLSRWLAFYKCELAAVLIAKKVQTSELCRGLQMGTPQCL